MIALTSSMRRLLGVTLLAIGLVAGPAEAQRRRQADDASSPLATAVRASIEATFDRLEANGDFAAAEHALTTVFDQVIAYADDSEKTLFRDAGLARRLVHLLAETPADGRVDVFRYLRRNPQLATALGFIVKPGQEKPEEIFAVLQRLRRFRGDHLNEYATLAAALCVVHERPFSRHVNENEAVSADPVALFDYFVGSENRMLFGVRRMPAELLIYVVDTTASIDEMRWALSRYAGDTNVGARFFDIEYDHDHFREGTKKKVTAAGWTLPNILRYGGVCADQAYFATTVGKSIGVPATYTSGASGEVSHAWVGFLQAANARAWWNFDTGRYEVYRGVRGVVLDPQTRRRVPDSYVSLLADFAMADPLDRQFAAATTAAAHRLGKLEGAETTWPPPSPHEEEDARRRPTVADRLNLLELGLRTCPGYAEGWFAVRKLASDGRLTLEQKKQWATVLHRLCGRWYPDFYLAILEPMIETVEDVDEQNRLWNKAFEAFQQRRDLAAHVRVEQGRMWAAHGELRKAGQCYEDVLRRYANAGPFVLTALREAEKILTGAGAQRGSLQLYEQTWARTKKPERMASTFRRQSNWYRVGRMYADRLERAGLRQQAVSVRGKLGG